MTNRALVAATLAMPLLINCVAVEAPPEESSVAQDSQINFAGMLIRAVGLADALNLNGYGCYCGLGNDVDVVPVDATDSCCMTHDYAWMGAQDVAKGCDCNNESYDYNTTPAGIVCTANQGACAAYCCAADKAFAECVQASPPTTVANRAYDRTTCEPLECKVDDDCEGGTWCNAGKCVPFCGGGGRAYAAADGVACDVPAPPVLTAAPTTADRATTTAN